MSHMKICNFVNPSDPNVGVFDDNTNKRAILRGPHTCHATVVFMKRLGNDRHRESGAFVFARALPRWCPLRDPTSVVD